MAAINFPDSPTVGETYSFGNYVWEWDGRAWNAVTANVISGPTGPTGPTGPAPSGATGLFTSQDGQTITVVDGIITEID
jgi:hypothetical protein